MGQRLRRFFSLSGSATVLDVDIEALVSALKPRSVAVFSGHLFRGSELDENAQQAIEADIRTSAEPLLAEHNVGIVYGALASGTDIILAETALAASAELDVVLPFSTERFIETSVKIGDPVRQARQMGEALPRHPRTLRACAR